MDFPKTAGQCRYMLALRGPKPVVIATGPAGTGKTLLACHVAMDHMMDTRRTRIILTRPIVAADEDMGYLPGTMERKMEPWTRPMFDIFERDLSKTQIERSITIEPLGYMRGRTFTNSFIIADEMQNATPNQMQMLLTRMGPGTKLIITGDLDQSDLGPGNGLEEIVHKMSGLDLTYMEHVEMGLEDIERHPAVNEALQVLHI
ncbi:PhoH family protein [Dishui Lake phycodnavirus 2]|nr:PhoH family protein [Dishui Lake phycodnavirus 2]